MEELINRIQEKECTYNKQFYALVPGTKENEDDQYPPIYHPNAHVPLDESIRRMLISNAINREGQLDINNINIPSIQNKNRSVEGDTNLNINIKKIL